MYDLTERVSAPTSELAEHNTAARHMDGFSLIFPVEQLNLVGTRK